jgi:hypothetical protein
LAAAILDRILERGRFIHLDGPSWRTRHLNLEELLPAAPERARISGIRVPEFPEPTSYRGWDDLYELRIVYAGVQYRPFGFYGPNPRDFTLLVGSIEKGKVPKSTLKVANERRKLVLADPKNRVRPHNYS